MDSGLAPFMQRNPIWPSTFPKLLSLLGLVTSMIVLFGLEKSEFQIGEIDYRRLHEYKLFQAIGLLALMAIYALTLRSLGFLISTASFLILGSYILGERKWTVMIPVGLIAAFSVWYLVSEVLEIYMRPLPHFLKLGN
jgi:putative tricarboxylic transport membrane protein